VTFSKVTQGAREPGTFTKGNEVNEERQESAKRREGARKAGAGVKVRRERRFEFSVEIFIFSRRVCLSVKVNGYRLAVVDPS
jgi:hypothetical protein